MSRVALPVAEAARELGVSEKAVRRRIERGTLQAQNNGSGVRVLIERPAEPNPREHARTPSAAPLPASSELLDRIERLARENGELRARRSWLRRLLAP